MLLILETILSNLIQVLPICPPPPENPPAAALPRSFVSPVRGWVTPKRQACRSWRCTRGLRPKSFGWPCQAAHPAAVGGVPQDRVAQGGQVHPELVGAPGLGREFHPGQGAGKFLDDPPEGDGASCPAGRGRSSSGGPWGGGPPLFRSALRLPARRPQTRA